eukprot:Rhum_TRINITY_DN20796_c0_g1::Rhum_TRINITY_DN20796_c0_g1_i1::g.172171::m.172171
MPRWPWFDEEKSTMTVTLMSKPAFTYSRNEYEMSMLICRTRRVPERRYSCFSHGFHHLSPLRLLPRALSLMRSMSLSRFARRNASVCRVYPISWSGPVFSWSQTSNSSHWLKSLLHSFSSDTTIVFQSHSVTPSNLFVLYTWVKTPLMTREMTRYGSLPPAPTAPMRFTESRLPQPTSITTSYFGPTLVSSALMMICPARNISSFSVPYRASFRFTGSSRKASLPLSCDMRSSTFIVADPRHRFFSAPPRRSVSYTSNWISCVSCWYVVVSALTNSGLVERNFGSVCPMMVRLSPSSSVARTNGLMACMVGILSKPALRVCGARRLRHRTCSWIIGASSPTPSRSRSSCSSSPCSSSSFVPSSSFPAQHIPIASWARRACARAFPLLLPRLYSTPCRCPLV